MDVHDGILILAATAAAFGAGHTIANPAHYLPFAAIAKSRGWGIGRTLSFAAACGAGHVLSSVVVGGVGIVIGAGLGAMQSFDGFRADIVKWLFLAFALVYLLAGIYAALSGKSHLHSDGTCCANAHSCSGERRIDGHFSDRANFWALFLIFTFGPCEILIPLVMYPASQYDWIGVMAVALSFSAATVATMLAAVAALMYGLRFVKVDMHFMGKWGHALTGVVVLICALLIFFEEH